MEEKQEKVEPPKTAGACAPTERCGICGRFLNPGASDTISDFTPDSAYTYERMEWTHRACEAKSLARSTFKMDFAP